MTESFKCDFEDFSVVPATGLELELKDSLAYYEGSNYIYKNRINRLPQRR